MRAGRLPEAIDSFRRALGFYPENAPALLGLSRALAAMNHTAEAATHRSKAESVLAALEPARPQYAAIVRAELLVAQGDAAAAAATLIAALRAAPPGFACWSVPIEPAFEDVLGLPAFAPVLQELAARAR